MGSTPPARKYAAGAAVAGTSRGRRGGTRVGLSGDGEGRRTDRPLLVTADLWSSQVRRGVQSGRARVRDPTIMGGGTPLRARAVARPGDGTPYRAPGANARSLDI